MARLAPPDRDLAEAALAEPKPTVQPGSLSDGGWTATRVPDTGDIEEITTPSGIRLAGQDGVLLAFRHETYDAADICRHMDSYLTHREEWAILDHGKPGLEKATTAESAIWAPKFDDDSYTMPAQARRDLGAPARVDYSLQAEGDALILTLSLRGKRANRMPEAGFLHITPAASSDWRIRKMGLWHDSFVRRGGAHLHAAEAVLTTSGPHELTVELLDAALVGPCRSNFMTFLSDDPDWSQGLRVNLYNNKWGTNFPMWWEGDVRFRFRLRFDETSDASV